MPHVVGSEVRHRRAGGGVACLTLLGLTLAALGHVAVKAKTNEVALDLGREQHINSELREQKKRLDLELSRLKDPGQLMAVARERLKMAQPAPADIKSVGLPEMDR